MGGALRRRDRHIVVKSNAYCKKRCKFVVYHSFIVLKNTIPYSLTGVCGCRFLSVLASFLDRFAARSVCRTRFLSI